MSTVIMNTNFGEIKIKLEAQKAPKTVQNFIDLVNEGFYDGLIFHRVIRGFMIQGGGHLSDLTRKETKSTIKNEAKTGISNLNGTISMARTADPHSASSQFFINVSDNTFLDFQNESTSGFGYCAFGSVIEGMDVVENISKTLTTTKLGYDDVPVDDVVILSAKVLESETV